MTAARTTGPPTGKQDNQLILYRLDRVEAAVKDVGTKVDKQDNIKRSDLKEFQETIVGRFLEMRVDMQRQIDDKADLSTIADMKKLLYSMFTIMGSIVTALVVYYITHSTK